MSWLKQLVVGKPLPTWELKHEKFKPLFGLATLSSDAISSVAYATEEILWVLIPAIGVAAYTQQMGISAAIIGLLALLVFSYSQTIKAYPNGGGAYTVAKENLGIIPGLVAGAALSIGYILTVAVSTSAGTAAITSAFPSLVTHKVLIALSLIVLITVINLRGVKESAAIFSVPTYIFIFSMLVLIIVGLIKYKVYGMPVSAGLLPATQPVTLLLILAAFSSGCTALTGVEAVSNSTPNFKEPSAKNAIKVLFLLAILVLIIFGGISVLSTIYQAVPRIDGPTVVSQIASSVFGPGIMFYIIQFATALILIMASNTAFNGFPMLVSVMAQDGYAPRQLKLRGIRLNYSNGIIILSIIASILIIIFRGDVHLLIPLYAVGVFLSFTLSQIGMTLRWIRTKEKGWRHKALINGIGSVVTAITVIIVGSMKFIDGAWMVMILIPIFVKLMLGVKGHYNSVANHLRISTDELKHGDLKPTYEHRIIVPIASLNKATVETLRYAKSLTPNVTAFHISIDEEASKRWVEKWEEWDPDILLVIKQSPYREIIGPFIEYIDFLTKDIMPHDKITILIPQFITVSKIQNYILHNQTSFFIREALLTRHENVVVSNYPYYINLDQREEIVNQEGT